MTCDTRLLTRLAGGAAAVALLVFASQGAQAQNPVIVSPDITADLGTVSPSVTGHENAAVDDAAGTVMLLAPLTVPPNVDVIAYEVETTSDRLLSFDTTVSLPGLPAGMPAEPRDVVRYSGATGMFSFAFDGSAFGVPSNARVDAVGVNESSELLLSFDITVFLVPVGPVDDEDLVRFAGGAFTMLYDGSANGVATALDLDGAGKRLGTDELVLSFDATGSVPGVTFDDEDAVAFDTVLLSYAMYYDGSLHDPTDWPSADLVALPEPGVATSLIYGVGLVALLGRRRRVGWDLARKRARSGA